MRRDGSVWRFGLDRRRSLEAPPQKTSLSPFVAFEPRHQPKGEVGRNEKKIHNDLRPAFPGIVRNPLNEPGTNIESEPEATDTP